MSSAKLHMNFNDRISWAQTFNNIAQNWPGLRLVF